MNQIPRRVVAGVRTLLYPDGPYIEVAERIRLLQTLSQPLCIQRAETLLVRNCWIYRVTLTLGEQHCIGDAEIHFGAPKETPEGTHPISCAHTCAIGHALTFAGWGDLRLLLERQRHDADEARVLYPSSPPYGEIEGLRVVWLDETPSVPVAERLYHLHRLGHTLSMERCEIVQVHGIWVYRVWLLVDGRQYIADAEVPFAAPDSRFPISSAQTAAVGNALALAGFGDVYTLLTRMGKTGDHAHWVPSLASAESVSQARRQQSRGQGNEREQALAPQSETPITQEQRATIRELSRRLGEPEPEPDDWTFAEAQTYIVVLQAQVDELLETADQAHHARDNGHDHLPVAQEEAYASHREIGNLKRAWMQAYGIARTEAEIRQRWHAFKQQHCQGPIDDDAMPKSVYLVLKAAIDEQQRRKATRQPSSMNGRVAHTPGRAER